MKILWRIIFQKIVLLNIGRVKTSYEFNRLNTEKNTFFKSNALVKIFIKEVS